MSLPKDLQDIVNFIRNNSNQLKCKDWTDNEISEYFLTKAKQRQVLTVYHKEMPAGIIYFNVLNNENMYIEQFWCPQRFVFKIFLQILEQNFPCIKYLRAYHQRRKRTLTFPVKQLIRIYGRR